MSGRSLLVAYVAWLAICAPAAAQMAHCDGDSSIGAGGRARNANIRVKAGGACELSVKAGDKMQSVDFVRILTPPTKGFAGGNGRNLVLYRSNGAPGQDQFEVGIGYIGEQGRSRIRSRTVFVTITP